MKNFDIRATVNGKKQKSILEMRKSNYRKTYKFLRDNLLR